MIAFLFASLTANSQLCLCLYCVCSAGPWRWVCFSAALGRSSVSRRCEVPEETVETCSGFLRSEPDSYAPPSRSHTYGRGFYKAKNTGANCLNTEDIVVAAVSTWQTGNPVCPALCTWTAALLHRCLHSFDLALVFLLHSTQTSTVLSIHLSYILCLSLSVSPCLILVFILDFICTYFSISSSFPVYLNFLSLFLHQISTDFFSVPTFLFSFHFFSQSPLSSDFQIPFFIASLLCLLSFFPCLFSWFTWLWFVILPWCNLERDERRRYSSEQVPLFLLCQLFVWPCGWRKVWPDVLFCFTWTGALFFLFFLHGSTSSPILSFKNICMKGKKFKNGSRLKEGPKKSYINAFYINDMMEM